MLKKLFRILDKNKHIVLLALAVFVAYFIINLSVSGPAILSDEIAYLTKAATIAGFRPDNANSWFAGYSFVLAPLFWFQFDPKIVWVGVMAINALLFSISFGLLFVLLRRLFPAKPKKNLLLAVAISAIYPAWIAISGYAYVTPLFILVYLCSILLLLKLSLNNIWSVLPFSLSIGILYWVHPIAVSPIVASIVILLFLSSRIRSYKYVTLHILIVLILVLIYQKLFHPWINDLMTPASMIQDNHYAEVTRSLSRLITPKIWLNAIVMLLGHVYYLLIATFGLVAVFIVYIFGKFPSSIKVKQINQRLSTEVYILLSLLGALLVGVMLLVLFLDNLSFRRDHWIYGRYTEMLLLPALAISLVVGIKRKVLLSAAAAVVLIGGLLSLYTAWVPANSYLAQVTVLAFWPLAIYHKTQFLLWGIIGAVGICCLAFSHNKTRGPAVILIMIVLLPITTISNLNWHKATYDYFSKPSGLVEYIKAQQEGVSCIGIDPDGGGELKLDNPHFVNYRLYIYYLYKFNLKRMTLNDWLRSTCSAYLTYSPLSSINKDDANLVGRDEKTNLYLIVKDKLLGTTINVDTPRFYLNTNSHTSNTLCILSNCFDRSAQELKEFMGVAGEYKERSIIANGNGGVLFFGPYKPIKAGKYALRIQGSFDDAQGASIEIVDGAKKYLESPIQNTDRGEIALNFELKEDTAALEIRVLVDERSGIEIGNYTIESR